MPTTHPCPDSSLANYDVRRAEASPPIVTDASEFAIPTPSCSFTWAPTESQKVTEDLWVLADASDVQRLLDELTNTLVASEWELYMEQSTTERMLVPAGAEDPTTRLIVVALDVDHLTNRSLQPGTNAVAATLIEDLAPDVG